MGDFLARAWAEIDLDAIVHNYQTVRGLLKPGVKLMAVVKADAYGHGVQFVAPALDKAGADWFAVSNIEEALQLREMGIQKPILILGYTPVHMAATLSKHGLSQTVFDLAYARALSASAADADVTIKIHIKLDTGMSRLGFLCHGGARQAGAVKEAAEACRLPGLMPEGIFTHFASADKDGDEDGTFTDLQFERFCAAVAALEQSGIAFALKHCCNSAATLTRPAMQLDMVRPGIVLYGLEPSSALRSAADLHPAMALRSVLSMVKEIDAGDSVSYGRIFTAEKNMRVATVPVGYADGYPRCLSGRGYMLVNGQKAPIIGRVCMDQLLINVDGIDAAEGQVITLFGRDGGVWLPVEDFAALAGTINYETVCLIGKRVTRVFYQNGREAGHLNYVYNGAL